MTWMSLIHRLTLFLCWRKLIRLKRLVGCFKAFVDERKANYYQSICHKWNIEQTQACACHVFKSFPHFHQKTSATLLIHACINRVESFHKNLLEILFTALVHHVKNDFIEPAFSLMLRNYFLRFNEFSQWDRIILSVPFCAMSFQLTTGRLFWDTSRSILTPFHSNFRNDFIIKD